MAAASVHVKRHLTPRERATIALALELLRATPVNHIDPDVYARFVDSDGIETDEAIGFLIDELLIARKVKVCRTKHKES